MRELVLSCVFALLGSGCVDVVSHIDDYDAGGNPVDVKPADAMDKPEVSMGVCQSGQHWTGGNMASALHFPGRPCVGSGCHSATSKTPITIGGTVYPLMGIHDDDDCNGLDSTMAGAGIAVLDENTGMELFTRLQVNAAGNFYANKALPPSFKVKIISQGREIAQMSSVMDGNCNSCHTKDGVAGAKGRMIPAAP